MSKPNELVVVVAMRSDTYFARCNGKSASCTSSAEFAAKAVAVKVWPRVAQSRLSAECIGGGSSSNKVSSWIVRRKGGAR